MNYNLLFAKAKEKNISNLEILEQTTKSLSIETYDNSLDNHEISNLTIYKIKATYNNKEVTLTTEYLDDTILNLLIDNSNYLEETKVRNTTKPKKSIINEVDYELSNSNTLIEKLFNLNKLKNDYQYLTNINSIYTENIYKTKITTEDSCLIDTKKTYTYQVEVVAIKDKEKSTYYNYKNSTNNAIDIENIATIAIKNAISKLDNINFNSGIYNIFLTNKVTSQIINSFIPIFTIETHKNHTSILEGKLNTKIFSDKVTIVEDPTNKSLIGKRLFDNDGIETKYKEIVKEGIFKTILYDEKTAREDNKESTGNNYGTISARNMYILPGTKTKKDILKDKDNYIIIDEVQGIHSGINITNGNISIQSSGYLVKNNKKQPIKLFVLTTNIIELLNNVIDITNDLETISTTVSSPALFISNIKISN